MPSTLQGVLPLSPLLTAKAQSAFVLDDLRTGTLVSLAQLCDDDCLAIFTRYNVKILKHNTVIITGTRTPNGLWSIPLDVPLAHQANGILRLDESHEQLAIYHHTTLGSPAPSTLLRAIRRGHLTTFPGLTTQLISKHLPKSIATTLGHQDQEAKNIRSTRSVPPIDLASDLDVDLAPQLETRSHHIAAMLLGHQHLLKSYSDQTGRFHVPSSRGNNYIFVLYHQDTNSIHAVAIPNRKAASIRNAWEQTHKMLVHQGHPPDLHILDNECSHDLKDAFTKYNIQFQRVPPKEHRVNAAERAIRTFKNHFVSVLCTVDSKFPLTEWDRLLPQTTLTLNLLRSSCIHPSLSAHASLFGQFDFNRTPLAPMGTQIVAHTSADTRTPFGEHGKVGWYIGPSLEHYRCWKCYFTDTLHERDVLKVDFFPEKIAFPKFSRDDYLKQTAEDMLHLLQDKTCSPLHDPLSFGPPILNAFAKVADILRRAIQLPPPPSIALPPTVPTLPAETLAILPRVPTVPIAPAPVPPPIVSLPPVPIQVPISLPRVPVTTLLPPVPALSPPLALLRRSPRARLSRLRFDPRTHRRHELVQSIQHDPTIAGKMYNPDTGKVENIDSLLRGPDSLIWSKSLTNEWGRCTQGLKKFRSASEQIIGNNTMVFIFPSQVPAGRKVTYANFVCTMRPGKAEPYRIRMTVGGDRLDAYQDVRSPAIGLTDTKLHLNSVISDAHLGARYCTGDLKDFFLVSDMIIYQYMRIHRKYLTPEVLDEYNLTAAHFDSKGFIYVEIRKGMYGLKEAAILAYDQLKAHLAPFGYVPAGQTPGLWCHTERRTTFTLAVDDFGIKFFSQTDADHLFAALATKYALTKDWTGSSYLGFKIDWNYDAGHVDISMPGYVPKALLTLRHSTPTRPQHSPHRWTAPVYGRKIQLANTDISPLLDKLGIKRVQQISGLFLYYSRGCDPTIIVALNEISNNQASPTEHTKQACDMLLDYLSTHPDATIRYHASDMILAVCSDAAYLVLPNARSRAAGHFFLTDLPSATSSPPNPTSNGAVHVLCKTIRTVAASASEAETGSLFLNAQEAVPMITALEEMGHPQPPSGTPLETDNSTAHGILHAQVRMKKSKAFDMRYHWLKDRISQKQFNLYWAPGKLNSADYFSKHHPPAHHNLMRYQYLQRALAAHAAPPPVRGCVSPSTITSGIPDPQKTSRAIALGSH
ncbi:Reverse transcriptase (RNA-dependent DNA polymerase) [Fragilaria crotonensis]|nr:Reverse transcriptase (RNA-dependent DNA polymerase) [Fragilaria crotonensis]